MSIAPFMVAVKKIIPVVRFAGDLLKERNIVNKKLELFKVNSECGSYFFDFYIFAFSMEDAVKLAEKFIDSRKISYPLEIRHIEKIKEMIVFPKAVNIGLLEQEFV